ncbi:hypothetical protein N8467_01180 [bacterium]|nr:hypothetical protein [bacterium]
MLEQAIVDAQALKEAALKNAEQAVIDKYSTEIKAAVEELLENNDTQRIIEEEVKAPLAAGPQEDDNEDIDVVLEYEFNPEDFEVTLSAKKSQEEKDQTVQENSIEQPVAPPQPEGGENLSNELDDLLSESSQNDEEEQDDELLNEILALLGEEIEEEELLDESLVVDMEDVKHGHFVTDNGARKYDAEMEMAAQQSTAHKEAAEELEKEVGELKNSVLMYQDKQDQMRSVLDDMKGKLEEMILQNATLLYSNKVLSDTSLNERQKSKIVEAIAQAETLKEAKALYTTLKETTVGTRQNGPKSLSESVQRKQVLSAHLPRRKQEKITEELHFATRMKKLAGLD